MKINFVHELDSFNLNINGVTVSMNNAMRMIKQLGHDYTNNERVNGDADICHFETPGLHNLFKVLRCKKPKVISAHAIPEEMEAYVLYFISKPVLKYYYRIFYNMADVIIAPSEFTKKRLREMKVSKRIEVVSNGVDTKKFKCSLKKRKEFRKKYDFKKDDIVIYTVGFIMKRKGLKTFLGLAKAFPEYKFVWVGKFTFEDTKFSMLWENSAFKVRRWVKNAPKNVTFTGFIDDIIAAHSGGDIFFYPSHSENEGISVLEASSCSKPIIVRDIGTYKGWLFNNKNCMKFKDLNDLKKIIPKLAKNKSLRQGLGKEARKVALKKDINKAGKKLINTYKSLLN